MPWIFIRETFLFHIQCRWQPFKMENGAGFEINDSDERTLNALSSVVNFSNWGLRNRTNIKELSCQSQDHVNYDDSAYTSCPLSSPKYYVHTGNSTFLPDTSGIRDTRAELEAITDVQCAISYMNELYEEKRKALQEENETYIKNYLDKNSDIFSPSVLSNRYNKVEILVEHVNKIAYEVNKLKSTLQKNVLNDSWKMHVDSHRSAVNFFSLAQAISEDVAKAVDCIKSLDKLQLENVQNMQLIGRRLITELYQSADIINEFKNCLESSTTQDNETRSIQT